MDSIMIPLNEMFPENFKWSDLYNKEIADEYSRYIEEIKFLVLYSDLINAIKGNDFNKCQVYESK